MEMLKEKFGPNLGFMGSSWWKRGGTNRLRGRGLLS